MKLDVHHADAVDPVAGMLDDAPLRAFDVDLQEIHPSAMAYEEVVDRQRAR